MIRPVGILKPIDIYSYTAKEIIADTHERCIEITDLETDQTFYIEQESIPALIKFLQEANNIIQEAYNGNTVP